jgi:hypothetical protein
VLYGTFPVDSDIFTAFPVAALCTLLSLQIVLDLLGQIPGQGLYGGIVPEKSRREI